MPSRSRSSGRARDARARALEAVGQEYDGAWIPIQYLSYAPAIQQSPQVSRCTPTNVQVGNSFSVQIGSGAGSGPFTFTATTTNAADVSAGLAALINAGGFPTFKATVERALRAQFGGHVERPR